MDNKATTKRMIGAVVLVLVAALLLAWLLKGKNRDTQHMAMNQATETKPILGFQGLGGDEQKPALTNEDPNALQPGQDLSSINPQNQQGGNLDTLPADKVPLATNGVDFSVRPSQPQNEVRQIVDTDGKVKDGEGSMGTGEATPLSIPPQGQATATTQKTTKENGAVVDTTTVTTTTTTASQQDKPVSKSVSNADKKTSQAVLVNENPVPKADWTETAKAKSERLAAEKAAEAERAAAKSAAEKAAAEKSRQLAAAKTETKPEAKVEKASTGTPATATAEEGTGKFAIQVMASADKAKADAVAKPLSTDGNTVAVAEGKVDGKTIYRVRIGSFDTREDAVAAQTKMKVRYAQNQYVQNSFVTR